LFGAGSFTASLVGGELADRLGRRPVMILSFLLAPANMIALGLARSLALIALLTLLQGLFTDLYRPAVNAAIADMVPPQGRPRAYGYIYWAINLGAALAPVAAGFLARFDYFLLFLGDALTTFIFGLIVLWGVRETRPAEAQTSSATPLRQRAALLGQEPLLLLFAFLTLFTGAVYSQGYTTLPVAMQANGLGPDRYGLALATNGALIVLFSIPVANAAVHWPRFTMMSIAAIFLGLGFGLTALATTLPFYVLTVAVWTVGEIAASAVAPAIVADLSPVALRGLYQGVFGAAWGLSFFLGPVLGGLVFDRLGPASLWLGCLGIGLLLAVGYWGMSAPARRRMAQTQAE
jgi:MFS family permease